MPNRSTVLFGQSHDRADRWLAAGAGLGLLVVATAANSAPAASYLVLLGAAATATQTADNGGLLPGVALTAAPALALLAAFLPIGSVRQVLLTAMGLLIVGVALGAAATLVTVALIGGSDRPPAGHPPGDRWPPRLCVVGSRVPVRLRTSIRPDNLTGLYPVKTTRKFKF